MIFVKEGRNALSTTLELQKDIDFCNSYMDNNVIQGNVKGEDFRYKSFEAISSCFNWCLEDMKQSTSPKERAMLQLAIENMTEEYVRGYNINAKKFNVPPTKIENFDFKRIRSIDKNV